MTLINDFRDAAALCAEFDWLATIDPHLHRCVFLDELYTIPTRAVHAGPAVADWIKANIEPPFLVGPDAESRQWVQPVAQSW